MNLQEKLQATQQEQIPRLDLSYYDLKRIPEEVYTFTFLETLDLSNNQLSELPQALNQLRNLRVLKLGHNQFVNFPGVLSTLFQLEVLEINHNKLTNIPSDLVELHQLSLVNCSHNQFNHIPFVFFHLKNLKALYLQHNKIYEIQASIPSIQNLEILDLSANKIAVLPPQIAQIPSLKKLIIDKNPIDSPPLMLIKQGFNAIKAFFKDSAKEEKTSEKAIGENHLLLIAIDDYEDHKALNSSVNNAQNLAKTLQAKYGFSASNTIELFNKNATKSNIFQTFDQYVKNLNSEDNLLVFFSGLSYYNAIINENYWIPVAAQKENLAAYISNQYIVKFFQIVKAKHALLINDAPFANDFIGASRGIHIAKNRHIRSRWIITASANVSKNSFCLTLLAFLNKAGNNLWVSEILNQLVQMDLAYGNPLSNASDEGGEWLLQTPNTDNKEEQHEKHTSLDDQQEVKIWQEAKRKNNLAAYQDYIRQYPKGRYLSEALMQINKRSAPADINPNADVIAWQQEILKDPKYHLYLDFLERFPDSKYAPAIQQAINNEEIAETELWEKAKKENTIDSYQYYLKCSAILKHKAHADATIKKLEKAKKGYDHYEAKVVILGNPRVGKTSIAKVLRGEDFDPNEPETNGISINKWTTNTPINAKHFHLNIWDFGGQELFHNTHRFFLTSKCLFLFIWKKKLLNTTASTGDFPLEYWLDTIKELSPKSPILSVQNIFDNNRAFLDNQNKLIDNYNIKDFLEVCAATKENISQLEEQIIKSFQTDENLKKFLAYDIPPSWTNVRNELELRAKKDYRINLNSYYDICEKEGLDEVSREALLLFLHDVGIVIHCKNNTTLSNIIILNPIFVTNLIYPVFSSEIIEQNSRFNLQDLDVILKDVLNPNRIIEEKKIFLELIEHFGLAFRLQSNLDTYIIPHFFPTKKPNIQWDYTDNLSLGYIDPVFTERFFVQILTALSEYLHEYTYWKGGALLKIGNAYVLLEANAKQKKILIHINHHDYNVKQFVWNILEEQILRFSRKAKFSNNKKMIPCPSCDKGLLYASTAIKNAKQGIFKVACAQCSNIISFQDHPFVPKYPKSVVNKEEKKVFLSYVAADEDLKKELLTHLKSLEHLNKIDFSNEILAGSIWKDETINQLEQSDIILLLISSDFIASKEIWETHIKTAKQRHDAQKAIMIPIIMRACNWEGISVFSEIQVLPRNKKAVSSDSHDINEVLNNIVKEIEKLIDINN